MQDSCHLQVYENKGENEDRLRRKLRESREFREFRESREKTSEGSPGDFLTEFELFFVDFQGLDSGLEGRWRNSKLGRCA